MESYVSRDILDKTMGSNMPVLRHLAEEAAQQRSRHVVLVYGESISFSAQVGIKLRYVPVLAVSWQFRFPIANHALNYDRLLQRVGPGPSLFRMVCPPQHVLLFCQVLFYRISYYHCRVIT